MDICMEEGKGKYIVYMKEHEHTIIEEGTYAICDLPLVPVAKKSKKAFKEIFQVVEGISDTDYEAACAAMSQNPTTTLPSRNRSSSSAQLRTALLVN
jgi:hypothetical protein